MYKRQAVTLLKPELDVWSPAEHNATFRGNQLAIVAAKAGLEYMLNEQVEKQVREKAPLIASFLKEEIATLDERIAIRGIGFVSVSYTHLFISAPVMLRLMIPDPEQFCR